MYISIFLSKVLYQNKGHRIWNQGHCFRLFHIEIRVGRRESSQECRLYMYKVQSVAEAWEALDFPFYLGLKFQINHITKKGIVCVHLSTSSLKMKIKTNPLINIKCERNWWIHNLIELDVEWWMYFFCSVLIFVKMKRSISGLYRYFI